MFRKWITLLLLVALVACVPAFSQNQPEGRIAGVVHDASGAVIPGAAITITNQGTNAKFTTTSGADGGFVVPTVPVGLYRVEIAAKGFSTAVYTSVQIDPAKTYSLTATLKVGGSSETVEVVAGQELVNTTTSEISTTVNVNQVQNLPLLGRDIIGLASTQPGVAYNQRANTSINGQRPSWSQVTLDGISIQDLFIRTNALDYIPNRPTTDTVESFTVVTGAQGSDSSMGASGVRMVTPSGTNAFHGSAWDYNRNSKFSANSWYNDYNSVDKPFRNRNEYGAKLLGPIIKNKLFFNFYYVAIKDRQTQGESLTIPQHDDLLTGVFRYTDASTGAVHSVNVLNGGSMLASTLTGRTGVTPSTLAVDPLIQSAILSKIKPASMINAPLDADLPNVGTYAYAQRSNYNRDNLGGKVDYELSSRNHIDGTFSYMHEYTDRGEYSPYYQVPLVNNDSHPKLFSIGWRYTVTDHLINTLRAGFNKTDAPFNVTNNAPFTVAGVNALGIPLITDPQITALGYQGRQSNSYQLNDNASWVRGKHSFQFGGSVQAYRVFSWNMGAPPNNPNPTYYTGMYGQSSENMFLDSTQFPGAINDTDVANAESLRAFLSGTVYYAYQSFNATSKTSGYVPGAGSERHLPLNDISFFGQDNWRVLPNLTLNLGLKWEYLSPYQESNGLALGPVYSNPSDPVGSLLGMTNTSQINFLSNTWKKQYANIGPSLGFAWDPFKDGKTSIRGGYSLTFVNDDNYRFAGNAADGMSGLSTTAGLNDYVANTVSAPPVVDTPTFAMPLTLADLKNINPTNVIWALDPNVKVPKVHELYFGIQRELPGQLSMEVRYVGTFGRNLLRGMDLNQSTAGVNPAYLADFARARANYFNCGTDAAHTGSPTTAAGTVCNNGYIAQALPFMATIHGAMTLLGQSSGRTSISTNAPAGLAATMLGAPGTYNNAFATFLPNQNIYALDYGTNGAFSTYHGMQTELRRRFKNGLQFDANYTWSKNLSNSPADTGQTRFDPFLDNNRPYLAKARSNFDLRHQFKANFVYDLPFGKGRTLARNANKYLNGVIGGWQLSSIYVWQSGNPLSILAARSTFNRRNSTQTAVSSMSAKQIQSQFFGVLFCPDAGPGRCGKTSTGATRTGVFYISPLLSDPYNSNRAVSADNLNNVSDGRFNQVFYDPTAGNVGNLGLMAFDGPGYQNVDMGLMKEFKVTERVNTKFRADFFNMPNHPQYWFTDSDINSTSFGRIGDTNSSPRIMQFSLRVEF